MRRAIAALTIAAALFGATSAQAYTWPAQWVNHPPDGGSQSMDRWEAIGWARAGMHDIGAGYGTVIGLKGDGRGGWWVVVQGDWTRPVYSVHVFPFGYGLDEAHGYKLQN